MSTNNNSGATANTNGTFTFPINTGGFSSISGGYTYTNGGVTVFIPSTQVVTIPISTPLEAISAEQKKKDCDGCNCKKCKEYFPYAEPNQEDGTLICYACRHGY